MIERVYFAAMTQIGDRLHSYWSDLGNVEYDGSNGVMLNVKQEDGSRRKIFVPFTNVKSIDHAIEKPPEKKKQK